MITDVFIRRYPNPLLHANEVSTAVYGFFAQAAHIIFDDLCTGFELPDGLFTIVNKVLSREVGTLSVIGSGSPNECATFLTARYDLWNDAHGLPDTFVKVRLSFLELLLRHAEIYATVDPETFNTSYAASLHRKGWPAALRKMIDELNYRFRQAGMPLHYHNGLIQYTEDRLTDEQIAEPFWSVVRGPQWENVDKDMKEAIDRRDNNERDSAGYAMRALESTLKIISNTKNWTTGSEKGASNFIDNLQSKRNGKFIDGWEAEILKQMFREIRNPIVHGEGSAAPLQLTSHQTNWVIEDCMSWIKNLIPRS